MIPIAITEATFNAVAASQWAISARRRARSGYKLGNHFIWLEPRWVASSPRCAGPGESYSDVIIWLEAVGRESLNGS